MDDEVSHEQLTRLIGTTNYLSPEVAQGRFSSRSDVWSLGVVFFNMLCGAKPFDIDEDARKSDADLDMLLCSDPGSAERSDTRSVKEDDLDLSCAFEPYLECVF